MTWSCTVWYTDTVWYRTWYPVDSISWIGTVQYNKMTRIWILKFLKLWSWMQSAILKLLQNCSAITALQHTFKIWNQIIQYCAVVIKVQWVVQLWGLLFPLYYYYCAPLSASVLPTNIKFYKTFILKGVRSFTSFWWYVEDHKIWYRWKFYEPI